MTTKDEPGIFMTFVTNFKLIRMINSTLIASHIDISATIERNENFGDYDVELAITKTRYWLEHIVSKTVAFSKHNDTAIDMFTDQETQATRLGNLFLIAPDEPHDEILAALIQSKMQAFSRGSFNVDVISIESDNLNGLSFTLTGDHASFLPQTMEEWLGAPSLFDVPWWMRDDRSTLDVYMSEGETNKTPSWSASLDFLDKRTRSLDETVSVVRPEFKPTIIKGGNDDDKD